MNKKFEQYLQLLESRAPESQKADFHNALELYRTRAAKMEMALPQYERNFSNLGKSAALNTFHTPGQGIENAKRSPEKVAADAAYADKINKAEENFPAATDTIETAAETTPGKVDAWVDFKLRPVIKRAVKADGLGGAEGSKAKYKADYKAAKGKYKAEEAEARAAEEQERKDAIARAAEIDDTRKAEEQRAAEAARMDDAAKKRAELGTNRDYKYDASMPLNATDSDINQTIATGRSEDMAKAEEADRQAREAEKLWAESGDAPEFGTPMSDADFAKSQEEKRQKEAEQKKMADFADNFDFDKWGMADVAAVNIKGLRAAFESVYGESKDFSDDEIRTICGSCYLRSRKK